MGVATGIYEGDDLYPICSNSNNVGSLLCMALICMYSNYPVALSPGIILSLAVLHMERLAFPSCNTSVVIDSLASYQTQMESLIIIGGKNSVCSR